QRRERTGDAVEEALAVGRAVRAGSVLTANAGEGDVARDGGAARRGDGHAARVPAALPRRRGGLVRARRQRVPPARRAAGPYARPIAEQLESFDRALALDPSFTPALIHPLEIVFRAADTARVRRYIESLRNVPASQAAATGAYRRAAAVLAGAPDGERVADALDHLLATMDTAWSGLIWQAFIATAIPLARAAALLPASGRDVVIDRMRRRIEASGDEYATPVLMQVLVAGGRLAEGRALLDAAAARSKRDVSHLARAAVLSGYAGKQYLGDDVASTSPLVLAAADLAAAID